MSRKSPINKLGTLKIWRRQRQQELKKSNRAFSLTWPASMLISWNKRKHLHEKRVQLPEDFLGTPTWPPFHCFGTPIWPPWRHVKTLYRFRLAKQQLCTCITLFFYISLFRHCTTSSWKYLIKRFIEDVNRRPRTFLSLSELGNGFKDFSSRRVRLHYTK